MLSDPVGYPQPVSRAVSERFKDEIEAALSGRVPPGKAGRPRNKAERAKQLEISV